VPKGAIARGDFFPRANPQSRGIFVKPQIFPGTLLPDESSIVFNDLLILRKSIESFSKFRKMQTQFCWIVVKTPTTLLFLPELFPNIFWHEK
jgi:hypothetical protein